MSNEILLDGLDYAILEILSVDARISNVDLALQVGLTPAPCLRRVKRLEEIGVIQRYVTKLNPVSMKRNFSVNLFVQVTMTNKELVENFERVVSSYEEVRDMRRSYGEIDYIIRVEVEDNAAYEQFLAEKMYPIAGVHRMVSHPTMKIIKEGI